MATASEPTACTNCLAAEGPLCAECEALKHACRAAVGESPRRQSVGLEAHRAWMRAVADLGDPARQAELLRAMLEVRGVVLASETIAGDAEVQTAGKNIAIWSRLPEAAWVLRPYYPDTLPALILALLAIPRQAADARERALRALEEAS